jgi:putative salt-induced outer membrane protein
VANAPEPDRCLPPGAWSARGGAVRRSLETFDMPAKTFVMVCACLLVPALAGAQASPPPAAPLASPPKMEQAPPPAPVPPPPPPRREGTAEFAFVGTTGNASTQTIGLGGEVIFRPDPWVIRNRVAFVRNESDNQLTAESLQYLFRAQRTLNPRLAAFSEYGYFRDKFAGILNRNSVMGGLSYKVVDTTRQLFFVDAGLGYLNEQRVVAPDLSTGTYALGAGYKAKLSPTAEFSDDFRFTGGFDASGDWRIYQNAALTARLTTLFSLKVSYTIRYANEPVTGYKNTDTTTAIALVAKF